MAASNTAYLQDLLREITQEKRAAIKKVADPKKDPGGFDGPSTHPSAKVEDDGLMDAREGFRSAENTADIKRTIPVPSVDGTPIPKPTTGTKSQDDVQYGIGLTQSATGDDPSIEDDYEGTKKDPGGFDGPSTHPSAKIKNEKYSADYGALLSRPFDKLARDTVRLGDELLAEIAGGKQAATPAPAPAAPAPQAGNTLTAEKQAAVARLAESVIKEAVVSADLVADFLHAVHAKHAGEESPPEDGPMPSKKPPMPPGAPGDDMGGGMGGGGPAGMGDPGPGGMGGPPPGMGGPPPGMGGGMPPDMAAAGGDAPGMDAPPGDGGPPASPEEAVHELAAALADMGITPDQLMQVAQKMHEGAGPAGPAPDPAKMAAANDVYKAAKRAKAYKLSGRFAYEPAYGKRAREIRQSMRQTLAEILDANS